MLYGASSEGLRLSRPIIYHGTWGSGLFQTLYRPGPAHWAALPSTLEWHVFAVCAAVLAGLVWPPIDVFVLAAVLFGASVLTALAWAAQAPLAPRYRGLRARLLVAALCYAQPLVRSWWRWRVHLDPPAAAKNARAREACGRADTAAAKPNAARHAFFVAGRHAVAYWDEAWHERTELLERVAAQLAWCGWAVRVDSGWSNWDLEAYGDGPWTVLRVYAPRRKTTAAASGCCVCAAGCGPAARRGRSSCSAWPLRCLPWRFTHEPRAWARSFF